MCADKNCNKCGGTGQIMIVESGISAVVECICEHAVIDACVYSGLGDEDE